MKSFFKRHLLIIIIATGLYGFLAYQMLDYKLMLKRASESESPAVLYCEENLNTFEEQEMIDMCNDVLDGNEPEIDFYSVMTDFVAFEISFFNIFSFALLVLPTTYRLCSLLKNKYIINARTRQSLNSFMKKYYKTAYGYIWLLPVAALILVIFVASISTFDTTYMLTWSSSKWDSSIVNYPALFILVYVLNIILHSVFFVNLALLVCRKVHNFIPALLVCFLSYLALEIFFELVISVGICQLIFDSGFGIVFNIVNMWSFSDAYGALSIIIFILSLCLISFLGVHLAYKNKESLILDCEKNN